MIERPRNLNVGNQLISPDMIQGREVPIQLGKATVFVSDQAGVVKIKSADSTLLCKAGTKAENGHTYLTFDLTTKLPSGDRMRGFPTGRDFVGFAADVIMQREPVDGVSSLWIIGDDNYNSYMEQTRSGVAPKEAALNTWSGRNIAQPLGFTQVEEPEIGIDGHGGTPFIAVNFLKPQ